MVAVVVHVVVAVLADILVMVARGAHLTPAALRGPAAAVVVELFLLIYLVLEGPVAGLGYLDRAVMVLAETLQMVEKAAKAVVVGQRVIVIQFALSLLNPELQVAHMAGLAVEQEEELMVLVA